MLLAVPKQHSGPFHHSFQIQTKLQWFTGTEVSRGAKKKKKKICLAYPNICSRECKIFNQVTKGSFPYIFTRAGCVLLIDSEREFGGSFLSWEVRHLTAGVVSLILSIQGASCILYAHLKRDTWIILARECHSFYRTGVEAGCWGGRFFSARERVWTISGLPGQKVPHITLASHKVTRGMTRSSKITKG